MSLQKQSRWDKFGIWVSSLCAVHCLALPIALPILPLIGATIFADVWFERTILSISLLVGFWALFQGFYRYHRRIYPICSLAVGGMIYWNKGIFGPEYEPYTITVGATLLVTAHILNLRWCSQCKQCGKAD